MKKTLFWVVFPLTFLLLICADILRGLCELYIDAFNEFEYWARFADIVPHVLADDVAEVCKGCEGVP